MTAVYQLIPEPNPFFIDLQTINNDRIENMGLRQRIQNVALPAILEYGKVLMTSMGQAAWTNITFMPKTLRIIISPTPNSPNELLIRAIIWIALHVIGFLTITIYVFRKSMAAMARHLVNYVSPQINVKHIKTKESAINVSHVPDNITMETLTALFDEINFDNKNAPGYMNALSRKEGKTVYTPEQLRTSLKDNFVRRVREKEPFLGTPPAWNLAQLHQFYGQIDNAVRFSLHKVIADYDQFIAEHGNWRDLPQIEKDYKAFIAQGEDHLPDEEDENYEHYQMLLKGHEDYKKYNELIEAKSRVAIDMAIAGLHCGGRYMGDSMDVYFYHKGEAIGQNLEDDLLGCLAKKREGIARRHIQVYLGRNVHDFAAYMANLGGLLGIPGTQNVIEHLGRLDNSAELLQHFFDEYTPDFIREAIQEKFGTSVAFRERIYDWLKDNSRNWNLEGTEKKKQKIFDSIETIQPRSDSPVRDQIKILTKWINELVEEGVIKSENGQFRAGDEILPSFTDQWSDFLMALMSVPEAKVKLDEALGINRAAIRLALQKGDASKVISETVVTREVSNRRNNWKMAMENPMLSASLPEIVQKALRKEDSSEDVSRIIHMYEWTFQVNQITLENEMPLLPVEILIRCYKNEANIKEVIASQLEIQLHTEFLSALRPDHLHEERIREIAEKIKKLELEEESEWSGSVNQILIEYAVDPIKPNSLKKCFQGKVAIETELSGKVVHRLNREILEWVLVSHGVLNPPANAEQRVDAPIEV